MNHAAVEALGDAGVHVLHITGTRDFAEVRERAAASGPATGCSSTSTSLADPLAACDLVIARAGGSVFEIAAAGRPAILVPYPHATADHQAKNARWMADAGAAVVIADAELTPRACARRWRRCSATRARLGADGGAPRARVARPDAAAADRAGGAGGAPAAAAARTRGGARRGRAGSLHFVGIGGAGMSGLALIAQRARAPR